MKVVEVKMNDVGARADTTDDVWQEDEMLDKFLFDQKLHLFAACFIADQDIEDGDCALQKFDCFHQEAPSAVVDDHCQADAGQSWPDYVLGDPEEPAL